MIDADVFDEHLLPLMCCPECDSKSTLLLQRGARGDMLFECSAAGCTWKFFLVLQRRVKLGSRVRGVPENDYLNACIAIITGSTYDHYAQFSKSIGLHCLCERVYYSLIRETVYPAAETVWDRLRQSVVFPIIYAKYAEVLEICTDDICPIAVQMDTRWQKRGTGKCYNSLDGTTFAICLLTELVVSVQNSHADTPTEFRSKNGRGAFSMSSSMYICIR